MRRSSKIAIDPLIEVIFLNEFQVLASSVTSYIGNKIEHSDQIMLSQMDLVEQFIGEKNSYLNISGSLQIKNI